MGFIMFVTKGGQKLTQVIEKAIKDSVITMAEYEEIMSVASQDGVIDAHEEALLRELNAMIANKTIKFGKSP
jgi:tellurite resistance protein